MFRLPAAHAVINRMGFNNGGVDAFVANEPLTDRELADLQQEVNTASSDEPIDDTSLEIANVEPAPTVEDVVALEDADLDLPPLDDRRLVGLRARPLHTRPDGHHRPAHVLPRQGSHNHLGGQHRPHPGHLGVRKLEGRPHAREAVVGVGRVALRCVPAREQEPEGECN